MSYGSIDVYNVPWKIILQKSKPKKYAKHRVFVWYKYNYPIPLNKTSHSSPSKSLLTFPTQQLLIFCGKRIGGAPVWKQALSNATDFISLTSLKIQKVTQVAMHSNVTDQAGETNMKFLLCWRFNDNYLITEKKNSEIKLIISVEFQTTVTATWKWTLHNQAIKW